MKAALGDLDKVARVVRLGGFINSARGFVDGPKVMNGASDLMVEVFGDKGRHARTTVGVSALPGDAAVEVEGTFEVAVTDPVPDMGGARLAHRTTDRAPRPSRCFCRRDREYGRGFLCGGGAATASRPIFRSVPMARPWCITMMRSAD